jgi:CRISPR/Cas system-associated endonuclease Cas1
MASIETQEIGLKEVLTTHYYKASYDQIKDLYLEILEDMKQNVVSINDDYCEIFSENFTMSVTAKIIMQTPLETSIDFFISCESLFGKSKATKFIAEVYRRIEMKYQLKGLGLHR